MYYSHTLLEIDPESLGGLEHIDLIFRVLDHDWRIAKTPRQKMLAARDHAVVSLFLESFIRMEELAEFKVEGIDLEAQHLLVRKGKMSKGRRLTSGGIQEIFRRLKRDAGLQHM